MVRERDPLPNAGRPVPCDGLLKLPLALRAQRPIEEDHLLTKPRIPKVRASTDQLVEQMPIAQPGPAAGRHAREIGNQRQIAGRRAPGKQPLKMAHQKSTGPHHPDGIGQLDQPGHTAHQNVEMPAVDEF